MKDNKIKIGIIGVGNCCSSLIQGIEYYSCSKDGSGIIDSTGLMHWEISGYKPYDIEVVTAFDIDKRKVGRDISEAIFKFPNCTTKFCVVPWKDVKVRMGRVLDGISPHMKKYDKNHTFVLSDEKELSKKEIIGILKESRTEVLLNYLPVGSEIATAYYADCALEAGCAFINCIPVFIASDETWENKFKEKSLPIIGDDIKSQLGATILHRTLAELFKKRGVKLEKTYQLNIGGNTDFLNMLNRDRLESKKISKTEAVQSVLSKRLDNDNIHIGPSDYVPSQKDNKVAFVRMEGRLFGNIPMNVELRLSVEDSPNSAGIVIDAIRCCKLALERKIGGALYSPSAYFMKHPPRQYNDDDAYKMVEEFVDGKREN